MTRTSTSNRGAPGSVNDLCVPPGTAWRIQQVTGEAGTRFGSTTNSASVSCGKTTGRRRRTDSHEGGEPNIAESPPVHPGEILPTEFLEPLGISTCRLAEAVDVPRDRFSEILRGRLVPPDTRPYGTYLAAADQVGR